MNIAEIEEIDAQIKKLVAQRDRLVAVFRKECKHLRMVQLNASPDHRLCVDCGAEERGWHCGYHVLVMDGDTHTQVPHKAERGIMRTTSDPQTFYTYRKSHWPRYLVGQSHPSFKNGGILSYEELTNVL